MKKRGSVLSGLSLSKLGMGVWGLGFVSLLNDLSSEMIYPLLPVFLAGLVPGSAALYVGLMDGLGEAVSSLLKAWSGVLSDRLGKKKFLAVLGYGLSSLTRPLMALASAGWHVVGIRFLDRVGKGVRTSPRDSLLAACAPPEARGVAFGLHRVMDHAGAVAGPLLAVFIFMIAGGTAVLWHGEGSPSAAQMGIMRSIFTIAFIPAAAAVFVLAMFVREAGTKVDKNKENVVENNISFDRAFWLFIVSVVLFALGNSSDLFLMLYAHRAAGIGPGGILLLWVFLHVFKMLAGIPGGRLSDVMGRRFAITAGWGVYFAVYVLFPFAGSALSVCVLLALYGIYYGLVEGAERALVADMAGKKSRGRAFGIYHAAVGLAALPASVLFGVLFTYAGPRVAFWTGALLAAAAAFVLRLALTKTPATS